MPLDQIFSGGDRGADGWAVRAARASGVVVIAAGALPIAPALGLA